MRQYVARPGQECKSELIVGAGLERVRWTVWYYQFWWLVRWNPGMHQGTNGAWDAFWKQAMSRQRKYERAAYSRPGMQWMKKDFEVAIDVFLNGADMVIEEEDRSDREGVYLGRIWARYKLRLLVVQYLESSYGNLEIDSMAYREPVQAGQNWRDMAVPRLLCNNSNKGVLNHLKASKIWCGRACKKRITIVKARADYCHGHRFCSLHSQYQFNSKIFLAPNQKTKRTKY